VPQRGLPARVGWLLRDYAKRVWDNSGEDNVFFLAGGIAFNILLAAVPFFLLLATGLVYLLNQSAETTSAEILQIIDKFMPPHPPGDSGPAVDILPAVIKRSGSLTIYSAIGFIWFSTRLFGSLRTVLAAIFDIDTDRGIIAGKIFDIEMTLVSSLLLVAYTALSAYLAIATTRGVLVLADLGIRKELMGQVEYNLGQILAFSFIATMFFCLY
jgi:membrane protein